METKKWYKSKVIWLNIISLLLEISQMLSGMNLLPSGSLLIITNILNLILRRYFTDTKLMPVNSLPKQV